jgi:hypothetical protein
VTIHLDTWHIRNTAQQNEDFFSAVTAIDPWQTPFFAAIAADPSYATNDPAPPPKLEPVPLSDLLIGMDYAPVERALEFIS